MATSAKAPFSEPLLPQLPLSVSSPFNSVKLIRLRQFVRTWVEKHLTAHAQEWEQVTGQVPDSVYQKYCEAGFNITHPIVDPADTGGVQLPANIPYQEWDTYCSVVVGDELSRLGYSGVTWGLNSGNSIGTPPIAKFASPAQRAEWLPRVARGEIRFCLGITEPDGGSDVARIRTTAEKNAKGDKYVVNGAKKWITNGIFADYCTAAVRTGGEAHGGLSLLVIPLKNNPGVKCRGMENSGVNASGE